jgi:hypothetical protein
MYQAVRCLETTHLEIWGKSLKVVCTLPLNFIHLGKVMHKSATPTDGWPKGA